MSDVSTWREVDTLYVLRAFGITMVVVNHVLSQHPIGGGLNILFILSGIAFAQMCFGPKEERPVAAVVARFARQLVLWSLILCLAWFAIFGRTEWPELLMFSNWITTTRVSKFPIWYTQVLVQMLLAVVLLLGGFRLAEPMRRFPVRGALVALGLCVALAVWAQMTFDTDDLADKLPHLHAWNFVVGWLFWAVLLNRTPMRRDRIAMTALSVTLLILMYLGLDVPSAVSRVVVTVLPIVLLIWWPTVALPHVVLQPVLLIAQATLVIFFLHYPFLLTVRELGSGWLPMLNAVQFVAALVGPVLIWALLTAGQRTWRSVRPVAA